MTLEGRFADLVAEARADPGVLAAVLYGSRAKDQATAHSDYDFALIAQPAAVAAWTVRVAALDRSELDGRVFTQPEFEAWADWGSPERWVRYAMDGARVLFDRTAEIQRVVDAKAGIPETERESFVDAAIDHFINQVYRCAKSTRDGDPFAAKLEAIWAIEPLLDAIFALDGGRMRPYPKHLAREIAHRPPPALPFRPEVFQVRLETLLATGDLAILQQILARLQPICREAGHGAVLDAWGEALPWMLAFRSGTPQPPTGMRPGA